MSQINEIRDRLKRLEVQVVDVGADAAAARVLATAVDRDVSEVRVELRAHTGVLNALRETQLEQGQQIAEHGQLLAEHGQQIVGLRTEMREGFAKVDLGMMRISTLLTNHLGKPDQG
jgi:diadenosine tetraphosphatase ApaH/serine/threonine PP2A family protein phosphatase